MSIVLSLLFVFALGATWGSFANVLVYRLPLGYSAVHRSRCMNCHTVIRWYQNIPIFSHLFLKGRCAVCGTAIGLKSLIVEILMGASFFQFAGIFGEEYGVIKVIFLGGVWALFYAHFEIDIKCQLLPDFINALLALLFLGLAILEGRTFLEIVIGFLVGFLLPLSVAYGFFKLKGNIGLGGGDIKLFGVLGIFLGWRGVLENIFLSCFLGAIIGILLMAIGVLKREKPFAFGPFIIIVAVIQIFYPFLLNYLPTLGRY